MTGTRYMKARVTLLATLLIAACSTTRAPVSNPAVEDFIIANQLEAVDRVRIRDRDGWVALNNRFVIYHSRRDSYLLEFRRECKALTNTYIKVPDLRLDQDSLRARIDTLRGCVISHIYPITTEQRGELKSLGDAPGS